MSTDTRVPPPADVPLARGRRPRAGTGRPVPMPPRRRSGIEGLGAHHEHDRIVTELARKVDGAVPSPPRSAPRRWREEHLGHR